MTEEKCKQYIKSDGLNFCMSSVFSEKDCIYALVYQLHQTIDRLEQERNEWKKKYEDAANENLKEIYELIKKNDCWREVVNVVCSKLEQENKELKDKITVLEDKLQLRMASDKESDAFWDEIFSAEDYPFNKENAYKELKDYYFVLEQIPKIYMEITGGTLSKTTYFASSVIQAYNDALERYYDKIDDLEYNNNAYRSALEEIKTVLKFYADSWVDEKIYPDLHYDNTKAKEGLSKINEVLQ